MAHASLFGKLPSELDFVRIGHDYPESIALEQFVQSALQRLAANKRRWPAGRLAFVMAGRSAHALVGTLSASRDRAGRHYPLAIYARVPLGGRSSAALPLACARFVAQAAELSGRSAALPLSPLRAALRSLCPMDAREIAQAEDLLARALSCSVASAAGALCPGAADPAVALRGALTQLCVARGSLVDGFNYPADTLTDISVWAAALERRNGEVSAVSALWQPDAPGRVLVAPGALPERALLYAAQPDAKHPRLCRGEDAPAPLEHSVTQGGQAQSLGELIAQLARR